MVKGVIFEIEERQEWLASRLDCTWKWTKGLGALDVVIGGLDTFVL